MKILPKTKDQFTPITVPLLLQTQEEAEQLWALFVHRSIQAGFPAIDGTAISVYIEKQIKLKDKSGVFDNKCKRFHEAIADFLMELNR